MNVAHQEIFDAALEIKDTAERKAMLDGACAGDSHLRRQMDDLLAAHAKAERFFYDCSTALTSSAAELAPPTADQETGGSESPVPNSLKTSPSL